MKRRGHFLLLLLIFTASPAAAFFGNPCLVSPYTYIKCYGENPGIFRTDLGNEILSITKEVWKVNSILSMLESQDLSFADIPLGEYSRGGVKFSSAPGTEITADRDKAVEYDEHVSSETGEKRTDIANSIYTSAKTISEGAPLLARTVETLKTAEMVKNYAISGDAGAKFKKVPDIMTKDRTDIPDLSSGLLKILESLGLGGDDLAIARDIAVNLAKLHEEEIRTQELRFSLADMRAQKNILTARIGQMTGASYSEAIRQNLIDFAPRR